ncbi:bifunctional DNA primase/polymerase [Agromyces endophyticus]|uniref:bifunctional DNA primase/polymerase n=1 Tax=Agromyces sp. H17E-10 TaxID=2932244 RepID=UPI001FD204D7|nr:bifunctional DNA primase/polymerase [Agromyces sp. H17E-10]UOQ89200.1 bifunctional DNA primase/polymerase [Agromyces sp. H17E-10]
MNIAEVMLAVASLSPRDAALKFAEAGVPVFPCLPDGKRPLTSAGFHDATSDLEIVRVWWSQWPAANLSMPTGPTSGFDVVDVDITDTGSGLPALEAAQAAGLVDGDAIRVRTPSGGLHIYFPAEPRRPQRCWQSASAHIDFRGDGGYVVVPPSTLVNGTRRTSYRVCAINSSPQHPVDASALRELIDPRPEPTNWSTPSEPADLARLAAWVSLLQEGERNHGLFWASCRLAEAGQSPDGIMRALGDAAASSGLSDREIAVTIRSAVRRAALPRASADHWRDPGQTSRRAGEAPCLR